ncbi:hypothetical protein MRX96_012366 [Rhipicephalus microplus]
MHYLYASGFFSGPNTRQGAADNLLTNDDEPTRNRAKEATTETAAADGESNVAFKHAGDFEGKPVPPHSSRPFHSAQDKRTPFAYRFATDRVYSRPPA